MPCNKGIDMATSTPSLGHGLLLFCELYAASLFGLAVACAGFVIAAKRNDARKASDVPNTAI